MAEQLRDQGFTHLDLEAAKAGYDGPWSIIATNKPFEDFLRLLINKNIRVLRLPSQDREYLLSRHKRL